MACTLRQLEGNLAPANDGPLGRRPCCFESDEKNALIHCDMVPDGFRSVGDRIVELASRTEQPGRSGSATPTALAEFQAATASLSSLPFSVDRISAVMA